MATPLLLVYGDVGTMVAAAVESYLYRSNVDWMQCGKQSLLGIVSRYVQYYIVSLMPTLTANFTDNQKSAFTVFVVSSVYHRIMEKKKSSLLSGFRTAQADTVGSEMVLFVGMNPETPIIGALGTAPATGSSWSWWGTPTNTTNPKP